MGTTLQHPHLTGHLSCGHQSKSPGGWCIVIFLKRVYVCICEIDMNLLATNVCDVNPNGKQKCFDWKQRKEAVSFSFVPTLSFARVFVWKVRIQQITHVL